MLLIAAAAGVGMVLKDSSRSPPARAPGERPELLVLTSLPIVFPEQFTLQAPAAPALKALQSRYRLIPISVTDTESLGRARLLLLAQPQAQPAEALVELDRWVRGGGRVLLLADPALEWRSERPLGDVLRPPLAFPDTGLLGHWGLRLDAPDSRGPKSIAIGDSEIRTNSPGTLAATASGCAVEPERLVARCWIGNGQAIVFADADFIDAGRIEGGAGSANLDLLLTELARLEH
jgi:hypothetical protein